MTNHVTDYSTYSHCLVLSRADLGELAETKRISKCHCGDVISFEICGPNNGGVSLIANNHYLIKLNADLLIDMIDNIPVRRVCGTHHFTISYSREGC